MKEEYLHYLWKLNRLPSLSLTTVSNETLEIINPGWLNTDAGPDFFNGKVRFNNVVWSGNIEIHVNSSDWYKHKHQFDRAYDNVVLHVVYNYDVPVYINEEPIPTLELKKYIDKTHFDKYDDLLRSRLFIPCAESFDANDFEVQQQIDVALFHRLERKAAELAFANANHHLSDRRRILMSSLISAFGNRANRLPFEELSQRISFEMVMKERWSKERLEALVIGIAGLLPETSSNSFEIGLITYWKQLCNMYDLTEMNSSSWKFSGVRPNNFPTLRLAQLVSFLMRWDFSDLIGMSAQEILNKYALFFGAEPSAYWRTHYRFGNSEVSDFSRKFTEEMRTLILINGLVPYLIYLKQYHDDFQAGDVAIEILSILQPEKNSLMKKWKDLGVSIDSAQGSQGLLELKQQFCDYHRCLDCKIGHKLLEGSSVSDCYDFYI